MPSILKEYCTESTTELVASPYVPGLPERERARAPDRCGYEEEWVESGGLPRSGGKRCRIGIVLDSKKLE